ncbi:MAG: ABC transporter ATP-binding protein [Clostridia bacterium]|nr:ABC transporter ATP-binding protein [Clostridia bacterium]
MFKALKNLKQSWIAVIFIVLLLIVQATCDLTLPDYTSKIINVGIQNGGIEDVAPEEIRKTTMDSLLLFTNEDEIILGSYEEKDNRIYKIKKISKEEKKKLNDIMARPLVITSYLQDEEMAEQIKAQIAPNTPNIELIEIIKQMPEEQKEQIITNINEQLDKMQDSILQQAAIQVVKKEYQAIGINTDNLQNKYIIISGLKMLGISSIIMISAISIMCLSSRVSARLGKTLREKIFKKVLSFSNKEFSEYSTASLITRSTNDIQQIQNLIAILFRVVVYAPIIGIGGFIRVLAQSDNSMAWIIGVAILAILFIVATLFILSMPKFKKLQKLIDKLNLVAREILTGLPVIRAFNTEKREEERFDKANIDLTKTNLFVNRAMSFMMPLLMLVMNCISLLIVWVGAKGVDIGTMQVGNMMAFIQYTMQIVMSFLMISMVSIILPRASVSANRINEVLETEEIIKESKKPKTLNENKKGLVEFKNVGFKYPDSDEEVLSDITFTAKPGETTAIIGSTGSGKSTIVNLIPRFYDITSGNLLIDGVDIKDISYANLRKIIGFVPQKGILFSGTIESNIKYGNSDMKDEQMIEAAKIAQATEFIESKPLKYQEPIAQGGSNVSGGQKQRLSIARAIAINPEIYVFDDSFSALDFKTDSILRAELSKVTKDKTVIIVAQRINTILNADQIIVLEDGKVVGKGTHEELLKNNETYREIALSQLSEEELNIKEGEEHE